MSSVITHSTTLLKKFVPLKRTRKSISLKHTGYYTCGNITDVCINKGKAERYQPLSSIPGPSGISAVPYIGFVTHFQPFGQYTSGSFHKFLQNLHAQYGDIVKQRFGKRWMIFLFNPDDIRDSLWQDEKYPYRDISTMMSTYAKRESQELGLAFQNGQEWEATRRAVQDQISPKAMDKYFLALLDIADSSLEKYHNKRCIHDTNSFLTKYTMECTGMLCFGSKVHTYSRRADAERVMDAVFTFLESFNKSYDCVPLYTLFRTTLYNKFTSSYNFIKDEVRERLISHIQTNVKAADQQVALLSHLTEKCQMTSEQLCTIIADIFITGVDSTANVLSFVVYHLAQNPECQEKIFQEIKSASTLSDVDEIKSFQSLPYLKACVKESMRLVYPLRDGPRRTLDKDTEVSGFLIPKGNVLVFCNNTICLDERYFPNAEKFLPERWLRSNREKQFIHPYALLPFGHGRRNCVGQRFAEQVMYALLVQLVKKFRISLQSPFGTVGFTYKLFSTPDKVFSINIEPRL